MDENNNTDKFGKNFEVINVVEDLKVNLKNSLDNASSIIKKTLETINENINDDTIRKEALDLISFAIQDFNRLLKKLDSDGLTNSKVKENYEEE